MVLESYAKVTSTAVKCVDFIIMLLLNALVVPLTLIYTALSQKLSDSWALTSIPGIHYLWWSMADEVIKGSGNIRLDYLGGTKINSPRTLLSLFIISAPVLIIVEVISMCVGSKGDATQSKFDNSNNRTQKGRKRR